MPAGGGTPTRIAADISWSGGPPVWSPDGRRLLVLGNAKANDYSASLEFFLVSPEGGASVKTGLASLLRARQLSLIDAGQLVFSLDWIGDALFFGSSSSIWTISFKDGSPQPETFGNWLRARQRWWMFEALLRSLFLRAGRRPFIFGAFRWS